MTASRMKAIRNLRLTIYRALTLLWLAALVAGIYFLARDNAFSPRVIGSLAVILVSIAIQAVIVRCAECRTRPGLWLVAVWTVFMDLESYLADTVLLRHCPKCGADLRAGSVRPG